jgi:formate transporter
MKAWAPAAMWTQLATSPASYGGLTWPTFFLSLIPVTIGNIIGGGALVGGVYYFIYLRKR